MTKNLHFCTPELLKIIKSDEKKVFYTFRTGFVPGVYEGDIVNLNKFVKDGNDEFIRKGLVQSVSPLRLMQVKDMYKSERLKTCIDEELKRYNRKFHNDHWFFMITIRKEVDG